jgi:hypothetical protein
VALKDEFDQLYEEGAHWRRMMEEWNTGPAHLGLAMEIGGDDRVAAGSAYFCYFGNRSSADTSTADGKSRPVGSAAGPGRAWCAGV